MALQKQNLSLNFSQGLDLKSDRYQIAFGKFYALENSIFTKGGLLAKRNGYGRLPNLDNDNYSFLTTYSSDLTALGSDLSVFSSASQTWSNRGFIKPLRLDTLPAIRSNTNQSQVDAVVSSNGIACVVYTDNVPVAGSNVEVYKYAIIDSFTGQNIINPTVITSSGTVNQPPKVFDLGGYFVIIFNTLVSVTNHLQYIAISKVNLSSVSAATDLSTVYTPVSTGGVDGVVSNGNLYLAWNASDVGGAIRVKYLSSSLSQSNTIDFPTYVATNISVTSDESQNTPVIYVTFYDSAGDTINTLALSTDLDEVLAPTEIANSLPILQNITSVANNNILTIFYEVVNAYSYDSGIGSNFIESVTCTSSGTVGSPAIIVRSVGLGSKAFYQDTDIYFLTIYNSLYQPTYFLCNDSGQVISKISYSNGMSAYNTKGLQNVTVQDNIVTVAFLEKSLISPVNKTQGAASSTGVYSQTGINFAQFTFGTDGISTAEIGNNLHISGGFLWMYDGFAPVEHLFHLWPDSLKATVATSGGSMTTQNYYYVATYEWTDAKGNIFRSAPSIPLLAPSGSFTGSSNKVTLNVPTLRLTYKIANPVKIVLYRWSTAQQTYYQVTSVLIPVLNDTTADSISYVDTLADSSIIGNAILYTTGGIVENIAAPATEVMTLYNSRLLLLNSQNRNQIWFSKQVIENTPVETSDLFTIYISPTLGAQGDTGFITALSAMDEKCLVFKETAIYYFVGGRGPDNTGNNNDFSEPTFITSTVGCANPNSIVFIPQGLMFQSDKGIWLLGRDLSTSYIGAPVEDYNSVLVKSALNIAGTNQVRFSLESGVTLVYDYYFGQWSTFINVPAISSILYQGLHTYINSNSEILQETPNLYLDGSRAVLMSFTTSWVNFTGLMGFERAYDLTFLGTYLSPHKLNIQISYDYNPSPEQTTIVTPTNFSPVYGDDSFYGGSPTHGGYSTLEEWQVYFNRQKCQAFQIKITEVYDSSYGIIAGAGFTMSGLNLTVGAKSTRPRLSSGNQTG